MTNLICLKVTQRHGEFAAKGIRSLSSKIWSKNENEKGG